MGKRQVLQLHVQRIKRKCKADKEAYLRQVKITADALKTKVAFNSLEQSVRYLKAYTSQTCHRHSSATLSVRIKCIKRRISQSYRKVEKINMDQYMKLM